MQSSAQILDLAHLAGQTAGDTALQDEILTLFVRQSSEILVLIKDKTTLPQTRADLAHKLKGSARAVGAFALADAAERVEIQFRSGEPSQPALAALETAFGAANAEIARYLTHLRPGA